jgi:hypothetical protein
MPLGSTFEIGTQIILLKIDGFLQRLILKYHPSLRFTGDKGQEESWAKREWFKYVMIVYRWHQRKYCGGCNNHGCIYWQSSNMAHQL